MNIILLCLTFTVFIFAVRLIGNRPNYATVTSTIIPKLYSNAGDYLYKSQENW